MATSDTEIATSNQRKSPERSNGDRLSSLPDEILSHILSFLQTKYAVGTAVLSRRWKDLWTRVSNLDLDDSLVYRHLPPNNNGASTEQISEVRGRRALVFSRFVDRVLSRHKNLDSVNRFRLQVMSDLRLKMELGYGSLLEEIDIKIQGKYGRISRESQLPESVFSLKNLKILKVGGILVANTEGSVVLPNLKILQLVRVPTKDSESLSRLISDCPVLETVHLELCYPLYFDEKCMLIASSPSLKNLTIIHHDRYTPIGIEAPNLVHLHLHLHLHLQPVTPFTVLRFLGGSRVFSCLDSAWVDMFWDPDDPEHCMIELLNQISNAKRISLSNETLDFLSILEDGDFDDDDGVQLPVFPNLTHLKIEAPICSAILHALLNSASKLQSLVIYIESRPSMSWESEPACLPECLLSNLEEVVIANLLTGAYTRLVAYLLKFGAVLKKLTVQLNMNFRLDTPDRKTLASLLELPRRSSTCAVRIFLHDGNEIRFDDDE